jgi:general L-amino acid transport system substrate-binding protein
LGEKCCHPRRSEGPLTLPERSLADQFADIVRWTVFAMVDAEEYGITLKNVDKTLKSSRPTIKISSA